MHFYNDRIENKGEIIATLVDVKELNQGDIVILVYDNGDLVVDEVGVWEGLVEGGFLTTTSDIQRFTRVTNKEFYKTCIYKLLKLKVGTKVEKNENTWQVADFDSWGRGVGVGEIVGIDSIHPITVDVRWPAGKCYENLHELKIIPTAEKSELVVAKSGEMKSTSETSIPEPSLVSVEIPMSTAQLAKGAQRKWIPANTIIKKLEEIKNDTSLWQVPKTTISGSDQYQGMPLFLKKIDEIIKVLR